MAAFLRHLPAGRTDLVAEVASDRSFRWASSSYGLVLGYEADALVGADLGAFVHPDDVAPLLERTFPEVAAGRTPEAEYRFRHAEGHYLRLESRFRPLEAEGELRGVVVLSRDVTERRRTSDILELLHETGRRALEREPVGKTLRFLCEELAGRLEAPLAWIGLKRGDGTVEVLAAGGEGRSLIGALDLRWEGLIENLPVPCRAIAAGQTQVASGPEEIPDRYRAASRMLGIGAVAACPLSRSGETLGVLAVHAGYGRTITGKNLSLLRRLADLAALALVESEQRDAVEVRTAALESMANAVLILDSEGRIRWANAAFESLTGFSREEVAGLPMSFLDSDLHPSAFWESLRETLRLGNVWRGEVFSRRKDGSIYVEQQTITPVRNADGSTRCFVAVRQDVTREKNARDRLRRLADHDALTDLPNRRRIESDLEVLVARAVRRGPAAVLVIDVDDLGLVNDGGGRLAGDRILSDLALLLRSEVGPGVQVGRAGGDEFALLVERTDAATARAMAEGLRRLVEDRRFVAEGEPYALTVTIGIAMVDGAVTAPETLAVAEAAVQAGKQRGRNRVVLGDVSLLRDPLVTRASYWVTKVKEALRSGKLVLHLQPIVDLASGRTVHHEALIRMEDGDGRLLSPGEFLPSAERYGLMPRIDHWVLSRVLDLLESRPDLDVFMNLSGSSLADGALLDEIERQVLLHAFRPGRLSFEITETAAVADVAAAGEWLRRLKAAGCRFALDDFGIGFSSFSYLQTLPVDYVKIDGSFIRSIDRERTNREIVAAIVGIAHSLGKETIAEAVECPSALQVLRSLGVEYGQGWLLGRPAEPPSGAPATPAVRSAKAPAEPARGGAA